MEQLGTSERDEARRLSPPQQAGAESGQPRSLRSIMLHALTAPLRSFLLPHERSDTEAYDACPCYDGQTDESALVGCAQRALDAEDVDDLSELLADFGIDVFVLRNPPADEDEGVNTDPVDRHPIAYLYARRVAQLAGVTLADDGDARHAYDMAREWCALRVRGEHPDVDPTSMGSSR